MGAVMARPHRVADWSPRLASWAEKRFGAPFVWGQTDCAMVCLEAIDVMCGTQAAPQYRGRWHSAASARRFARRASDLPQILADVGLMTAAHPPRRGDLLTLPGGGWQCGYVCFGDLLLSVRLDIGVALTRTAMALHEPGWKTWRVA